MAHTKGTLLGKGKGQSGDCAELLSRERLSAGQEVLAASGGLLRPGLHHPAPGNLLSLRVAVAGVAAGVSGPVHSRSFHPYTWLRPRFPVFLVEVKIFSV